MPETATRTAPETDTTCPTCGAPAQTGQLICLECGSRIALAYRRPPSWHVPAAIVSVIVLALAAGLYFGIDALTDDAEKEVASQPVPASPQGDGEDEGAGQNAGGEDGGKARGEKDSGDAKAGKDRPAEKKGSKEKEKAEKPAADEDATAPPVATGGIRAWPEGEDAYTVVILSSEDRSSARAFAQNAVKAGTKAGVLRADDYPALNASTGFFIVFVGSYPNQAGADRAAARLGRRYQGAYPQFVDGSKSKR